MTIDLRDVGPCVRRAADRERVSAAVLIRRAVLSAYGGQDDRQDHAPDQTQVQPGDEVVKITLRVRAAQAAALAARARAADMAQGDFVGSLLDGTPPAPLATDCGAAIAALMASTDRLAAMSTDLNAFMQFVGRVPVAKLEPLRANLGGLIGKVREHLALSAALVAELRPRRRTRR